MSVNLYPKKDGVGIEAPLNGTTTPLASSAVFTGEWQEVSAYDSLITTVKTDQNGTLTIEFSPDGVNQDSTLTRYYRTPQIEAPHRFTIGRKYFRVTFTNTSATLQTYLRVQTLLGPKGELNAPLDSTLAQDFDAIATRPTDYTHETALGLRQGATSWNKFAYNTAVSTSAEIIASWGGTFQFLTVGETLDISSLSTNDTNSSGTGARQIVITGVNEDWEQQTEIVNMNGTTTVTTVSEWIGINRVSVYLAGTGQENADLISITATTSGYTMAEMPAGEGVTQQAIFYVPISHQFLSTWLHLGAIKSSGGGNPEVNYKGWVYSAVSNCKYQIFLDDLDTQDGEHITLNPAEPFQVGEKSILWFEATSSAASTSVKCRFSGKLVRDVDA